MKKLRILVDVDDVIVTNHFLPVINDYLHKNLKEDDFKNVWLDKEYFPDKKERNKFLDFYLSVDSYAKVKLKPHAKQVLQGLCKRHEVFILTNALHPERSLEMGRQYFDKWQFLLTRLPFFLPDNIIYSQHKDIFIADVIIDDRVDNMTGPYKHKLLFTCFHNKNIDDETLKRNHITRVNGWDEVEKYIKNIEK